MNIRFADLGLSKDIMKSVEEMGFEEASPIQEQVIPHLLAGCDVVGQAQTGTGKTAAFGIPILERVEARNKLPQALVLCPTRELTVQVAEEIRKLAAHRRGIFALAVYGGQPIDRQIRSLAAGAQIIVATPGRIKDHLERGPVKLDQIRLAVLDEADEMLDMGFRDDIEAILALTPEGCQTAFFSATLPADIMELAKHFLNNPKILKVTQKLLTVPGIEQVYYEVRAHQKTEALCLLLDSQGFHKTLVFCSTKRGVDDVAAHLQMSGYQADALHGNLSQPQRDRVMKRFRAGGIDVLVATDVAARGLDVEDVDAVVNYDIPNDVEDYVHRIGRTGRAGKSGRAFTFVSARDSRKLRDIINYTKATIRQSRLPSLHDVTHIRTARMLVTVRATIESGSLESYTDIVERFLDEHLTSTDMAAALLKILMQREFSGRENLPSAGSSPAPVPERIAQRGDERFSEAGQEHSGKFNKGKFRQSGKRSRMLRLFFNVGENMQVTPGDVFGALAGEAGLSGRSIGAIEIRDRFCFAEVPAEIADEVIHRMNGVRIRGFRITAEKSAPKM
jgi:ATP-dependent RNA helicase DeaD